MSNAPTKIMGAPITDHRMSPDMNDPPITPTPWKNQTPPTSTSSTPSTRRTTATSRADSTAVAADPPGEAPLWH